MVYRPSLGSVHSVVGYCSLQASIGASILLLVTAVYKPTLGSVYTVAGYCGMEAFIRVSIHSVFGYAVYRPSLGSVHCC